jgi:hypothetical protein
MFAARNLTSQGTSAGKSLRSSSRAVLKKFLSGNGPINAEAGAIAVRVANGVRELGRRLETVLREQVELELREFLGSFDTAVERARSSFGEAVDEDADVRFALDDLGPQRIEAAVRFLSPCSANDYVSLREFLTDVATGVGYDVDQAEDPADVGDALLRGLENLHGFLLTKNLVKSGYRSAQDEPVLTFRPFIESGRRPDWRPKSPGKAWNRERRFSGDDAKHRVRVS